MKFQNYKEKLKNIILSKKRKLVFDYLLQYLLAVWQIDSYINNCAVLNILNMETKF